MHLKAKIKEKDDQNSYINQIIVAAERETLARSNK